MKLSHLCGIALGIVACGGAAQDVKTPPMSSQPMSSSTTPEASTVTTGAKVQPSAAPARDPKIVKLATAVLACKLEDDAFDEGSCPAYKAWRDNEDLFADGKGDDTIFSMMGDTDLKVRTLATDKGVSSVTSYFSDPGKAARLFELARNEQNPSVARSLVNDITRLDADELGLGSELMALAKSPLVPVRTSLASCIAYSQGPSALAVIKLLLNDADPDVKKSAIGALSTGGITPGVEPVCKLLTEQLARTDNLAGDALWSGSSSKCDGMDKAVVDALKSRVANPATVTNAVGIGYTLAAAGVCTRTKSPELKKAGFEILKKLTDTAVKDTNTRSAATGALGDCDPVAAVALARNLANDKDKNVAERAKKVVDRSGKR